MAELPELSSFQQFPEKALYQSSDMRWLKAKATALAMTISMLPILGIGTAIYHFGSQAIEHHIEAEFSDSTRLQSENLIEQRKQLVFLLLGTGATALLSGLVTVALINRTLRLAVRTTAKEKLEIADQNKHHELQQFAEIIHRIRKALTKEEILRVSVEEARRAINSDRVVIYALGGNGDGTVVAESVTPTWLKAMQDTIHDPCFGKQYIEAYREGRFDLTDDAAVELSPCYAKQLEASAAKANLVTPILNGSELFGLLVAHQCSAPRHWEQFEIESFAQIAAQVGISLDNARFQQQAAAEVQIAQWFQQLTHQLRETLNEPDILKVAVEFGRKMIAADRLIVVCALNENAYGTVVAESVVAEYPKMLEAVINDPCFSAQPIKSYRQGWVNATNDIYEAGLTPGHIEQLKPYSVRANLVTPIIQGENLFGLLIAHQCTEQRQWQEYETQCFSQIAAQMGFALEKAQLAAHTAELQKQAEREIEWKDFFTASTQQIHASLDPEDVFKTSVEQVRSVLACDRVLIYSVDCESMGIIIAESVEPGFPKALGRKIEDPCFEARYIQKYENGRVHALNNIHDGGMTECYIEQLDTLEVKANLVAPVLHEGKLLGLLVAHQCSEPRQWKQLEIGWFQQIAVQVGYALDNARLLGRVNQMSQALVERVIEMSQDSGLQQRVSALLETLSKDAQHQVETATSAIESINTVTEAAQEIVTMVHQTELNVQQADQTVQAGQELINQTVDQVSNLHQFLIDASAKLKHLGLSSQKITEALTLIDDLAAQMNQEVMHLTITAGQAGESHQTSILLVAEAVRALSEQVSETTASTESLASEIVNEVNTMGTEVETGVEQIYAGTRLAKETHAKLSELAAVSAEVGMLIGRVAQAAANQVQTSMAGRQITLKLADVAHRTSDQSMAVVQSFTNPAIVDSESPIAAEFMAEEQAPLIKQSYE
jgi:methyl-accepting chemotaxis protein PixJ